MDFVRRRFMLALSFILIVAPAATVRAQDAPGQHEHMDMNMDMPMRTTNHTNT